ncbi:MAG: UDP-glucose 4-epimerase GalE [Bacteroidales bacterium]|nr:UDP-glucose 4-epimerase GalE [Bacteroidales bacterium]MDD3988745.1 UDP-glucose 4-epimerase GalE [Bacteroidales bacterium]
MGKRQVLVTGGAGYIGAHTAVELHAAGYEVIIADNFSNSSPGVLEGIERITGVKPVFHRIDCADRSQMVTLFKEYPGIEAVIHFAAFKSVGESVLNPLAYYRNNLLSMINLLGEMSVRERGGCIVFSSSCTVYGQPAPEHLPVSEEAPLQVAASPYGRTKQICEDILSDTVKASEGKLKAISLRYFNPVGAHPSAYIGELPGGVPQNLLPFVTQTAAGLRECLNIFGSDYNTPDGTCIRDYIYVCDLAKAHIKALERMTSVASGTGENMEYFNLGTGKGLSVMEVVKGFVAATGVDVPYKITGRRAGDVEQVWADPSKANRELGWRADTPMDQVYRSAWEWEKRIRNL